MIAFVLSKLFPPRLGKIDCHAWRLKAQIDDGSIPTYEAHQILGTGYRVFEWGNGRHKKPTFAVRVHAE